MVCVVKEGTRTESEGGGGLHAGVDWILLWNVMLGNFLAGASARIFAISLPTVAHDLGTDLVGISWALLAYELTASSFSVVFGRIGDLYGRHIVYGLGLVLLTVSSFLCGVAQNIFQLVLFRLLQGVAGAMTQSTGRALAMETMPEDATGRSQGFMTTAFATGNFLGPSLGGLIIDYIHWRGIFFFLVPIGAAAVFLTFWNWDRWRSSAGPDPSAPNPTVDYLGAGLLMSATVAFMASLNQKVMQLLDPAHRVFLILVFSGLFLGFLLRESRARSPIVELSLFKIPMFAFSSASLLFLSVTFGLTYFILPFYLQEILHLSPSFIGILFIATPFFPLILSAAVGYITDITGPRLPATIGVIFHIISALLGTALKMDSHWGLPLAILALAGLGNAFFLTPNHTAMIGSVPKEHRGFATGSLHLTFSLGTILGVSLGTFLMTALFRFYAGNPEAVPTPLHPVAFVSALNMVFGMAVVLCLAALVASAMRGSKFRPGSGSET